MCLSVTHTPSLAIFLAMWMRIPETVYASVSFYVYLFLRGGKWGAAAETVAVMRCGDA